MVLKKEAQDCKPCNYRQSLIFSDLSCVLEIQCLQTTTRVMSQNPVIRKCCHHTMHLEPSIQAESEYNAQSGEAGGTEADGHTHTQNTN